MTERERILRICQDLPLWDWPKDEWFINGSGSMIMHGITAEQRGKPMGDLDIFVATDLWFDLYHMGAWTLYTTDPADPRRRSDPPLLRRTILDLDVDVFQSWRVRHIGDFDVAFYMNNSVIVDDVPCVPLQFILDWKCEVGRAKDVRDVAILERWLEGAAA
jgi:hypothetical protein